MGTTRSEGGRFSSVLTTFMGESRWLLKPRMEAPPAKKRLTMALSCRMRSPASLVITGERSVPNRSRAARVKRSPAPKV